MWNPLPLVAAALALTASANADKIYFKAAASDKSQATGQSADPIIGKIIREDAKSITIRVVGGEIVVDKNLVARVEKDDTTAEDVAKQERDARKSAAAADASRRDAHRRWVEASTDRARRAVETGPRESTVEVDFKGVLPRKSVRVYNPVLHRIDEGEVAQVVEGYLREQLRDAPMAGRLAGRDPYVFYNNPNLEKKSPGRFHGPNPYEGYDNRRLQDGVERNRKHKERLARLRAARVRR